MKIPDFSRHSLLIIYSLLLLNACSNNDDKSPEFVEIPDAQFERRLIDLGVDSDNTVNQRISRSDALAVTELDVSGNNNETGIVNLSGIEAFINLELLNASSNKIKSIDLSQNARLKTLKLEVNLLESVDLSANTALTEVNLHFNELTSISGLTAAVKLKKLNLSWNYLESLTLDLPELEELNVEENKLNMLNINNSPKLISLLAKMNQLTELNTSQNLNLTDLIISGNNIESIDLSNNTALELLWISANELINLDVSKLHNLNNLSIIGNPQLYCVTIAKNQSIATVNKEFTQMLFEGGCW